MKGHDLRAGDHRAEVSLMAEDVAMALRPYGIDPADGKACAAALRAIANALARSDPDEMESQCDSISLGESDLTYRNRADSRDQVGARRAST